MNRYSITSDSDRWWVPTAIAGTIGAAAVAAILVVPLIGAQAAPPVPRPDHAMAPDESVSAVLIDRPCYLARPGWNTPTGWEQPVCWTELRRGAEAPALGARRPLLDYLS